MWILSSDQTWPVCFLRLVFCVCCVFSLISLSLPVQSVAWIDSSLKQHVKVNVNSTHSCTNRIVIACYRHAPQEVLFNTFRYILHLYVAFVTRILGVIVYFE